MCGINGFNFNDPGLIGKMNAKLAHRGPDASGQFMGGDIYPAKGGVSLGHARLSIIDLDSTANQPMASIDGRYMIIFNGEIYNFPELKEELAAGYEFRTRSDTEVILAAYVKWGKDCVKKFNGIFAFVVWDKSRRELFLARDPLGVKPLYYYQRGNVFIFSSEIKAILEYDIPRKIDREAFSHYFRLLYVPEPFTIFSGIHKFPPASYGVFKDNKLSIEKYWHAERGNYFSGTRDGLKKELAEQVDRAVGRQMISDRPLGVFLSGGIDSSIMLNCARKINPHIDTFSVGFDLTDGEEKEKFNRDFFLARKTAEFYGTKHHEILLDSREALRLFEETVYHMDEPISNPTAIARLAISRFAKNKVAVVLGGDGGDELFGGYPRYRLSLVASHYRRFLPEFVRRILDTNQKLKKMNTAAGIERFSLFMFQKDEALKSIINDEYFNAGITAKYFHDKYFKDRDLKNFEEVLMDTDLRSWLSDESLAQTDKMSMAAGLEARVPLLDKELVEFAYSIPLKYKINFFDTKIILKEAFKSMLPAYLFSEPKRGWFSPAAKWLRHPEFLAYAKSVLSPDYYSETRSIFNWLEIAKVIDDHYTKRKYNLTLIWSLMTFQVWAKKYGAKI